MATAIPWSRATAFTSLKAVADTATGITFVAANQAGPAPALPYGTFLVTGGPTPLYGAAPEHATYDSGAAAGEEMILHSGGQARLAVRFQVFSDTGAATDSAISYLDRLSGYLQTSAADATLDLAALAVTRPAAPTDISEAVGAKMQSRASMDVDFNTYLNTTTTTGYIANVILTGDTLEDVDGTDVYNESTTVTLP